MLKKIYQDLFTLPGISGYEKEVRHYMENHMKQFKNFDIKKDHLGSIFAYKKSKNKDAKTLMIAGHMDEVGLMVTHITEFGMLKVSNVGGLNGEVFISQVLNVHTSDGIIPGVIGALPPHLKTTQKNQISDLLCDIGATSKKEAESFGVALGNMVTFINPFYQTKNPKRYISKAIDNRYGCGLSLELIEMFNDIDLDVNLVIGATVQEEVGLRGAETSVNLFNPDVFIALDASPVNDMTKNDALGALGKGFLLRMYDPRNTMLSHLFNYVSNLAQTNNIPFQYFTSLGGTDAAKALDLNEGVLATTIGLPARYIHSSAAMMDLDDLNACKTMMEVMIKDLTSQKIERLCAGHED